MTEDERKQLLSDLSDYLGSQFRSLFALQANVDAIHATLEKKYPSWKADHEESLRRAVIVPQTGDRRWQVASLLEKLKLL